MPLLSKFGQLLPYFVVRRIVRSVAPREAVLKFGKTEHKVRFVKMDDDEFLCVIRRDDK